jgi:hypothetical protein
MWTMTVVIGLLAAAVVVALLVSSRRPRPADPHAQPPTEQASGESLPEPGSDEVARRPDGSLMPGSEEYRNRRGKP